MWTAATDKDDPLRVLKAFQDYFKPVQKNTIVGTHLGFIVANLSPSQNSWSNYVTVSENVRLKNLMRL